MRSEAGIAEEVRADAGDAPYAGHAADGACCPLWPRPLDPDDADASITYELAGVLSGRTGHAVALSGDVDVLLAGQPFSEGIAGPEWNLSDDAAVGHCAALFFGAGADCVVTHTAGCDAAGLAPLGLAEAEREVNVRAVRAARSSGARFVMGLVGGRTTASGEGGAASLAGQASTLASEGVHAVAVATADLASCVEATRAVSGSVRLPVVPVVPVAAIGTSSPGTDPVATTPDGVPFEDASARLVEAGAFALGARVGTGDAASLSTTLASAAEAMGRGLVVCLVPDDGGVPVRTVAERLAADGARAVACGGRETLRDTAAVAEALRRVRPRGAGA